MERTTVSLSVWNKSSSELTNPQPPSEVGRPMNTDRHGVTVLDVNICLDLLRSSQVGRLAVSVADHPEIFPVNFLVEHGAIVFRTGEDTKMSAIVFGSNVAFEVDGYDAATGVAWSVVMKGWAGEIKGMHERFEAAELPLFPWHAAPKSRFVRIEPVEITGRRFHIVDAATWGGPKIDPTAGPLRQPLGRSARRPRQSARCRDR